MKYMPSLMLIPHERLEVFLDISKAFDRVWHEGLIYKIKWMDVKGDLLALIESFSFKRQQRAVLMDKNLNGWCSSGFNYWSIVFYIY